MEELNKRYYGIREVADMFNINVSKLRFYEKEFPSLKPKKNRAGDRIYTKDEITHLREIFELVEVKGLTLQGARDHFKNRPAQQGENAKMVAKLRDIRGFLVQLRDSVSESDD